jgi:uncharacterized protein YggT (Ycf19 family)
MNEGAQKARLGGVRFAKVLVWLVYAYFVAAVIILIMTFFLELFNASPDAGFTQWVYRSADSVLAPFEGIFPAVQAENGSVIDFAVLFAIIMYGIFAMVVHALVTWLDERVQIQKRRVQKAEREAAAALVAPPAPTAAVPAPAAPYAGVPAAAPAPIPLGDQLQAISNETGNTGSV